MISICSLQITYKKITHFDMIILVKFFFLIAHFFALDKSLSFINKNSLTFNLFFIISFAFGTTQTYGLFFVNYFSDDIYIIKRKFSKIKQIKTRQYVSDVGMGASVSVPCIK